jgi:hypothetical protein
MKARDGGIEITGAQFVGAGMHAGWESELALWAIFLYARSSELRFLQITIYSSTTCVPVPYRQHCIRASPAAALK